MNVCNGTNDSDVICEASRSAKIAKLNDEFRVDAWTSCSRKKGEAYITRGFSSLSLAVQLIAITLAQTFYEFTEDNDPHGEHDFGSIDAEGYKFFWKIDYYDKDKKYGSPDPTDPEQTTRVITLMLAEEY